LTSDNPESMMERAINLLKSTKNPDLVCLTVHYKIQATPRESEAAKAIERLVSEGKVQKPDELEQKM
jgi:hypothetical protein